MQTHYSIYIFKRIDRGQGEREYGDGRMVADKPALHDLLQSYSKRLVRICNLYLLIKDLQSFLRPSIHYEF